MGKNLLKIIFLVSTLAVLFALFFSACADETKTSTSSKKAILVSEISIEGGDRSLFVGEIITLSAVITPPDAANKNLTWNSDDTNIVTVDETGLLTALSAGETTVSATAKDGSNVTDSITVKVNFSAHWDFQGISGWTDFAANGGRDMTSDAVYHRGMTLLGSRHPIRWLPAQTTTVSSLSTGCVQTTGNSDAFLEIVNLQGPFKITFWYTNTTNPLGSRYPVLYVNGNQVKNGPAVDLGVNGANVRRILEYNYFKSDKAAVQLGSVGTFRLYDAFLSEVTDIPVSSVKINEGNLTISAGGEKQLSAAILPENATTKTVTWSSSDTNIVTVSAAGLIKGVSEGTADIFATARCDSAEFDSVTVTVGHIPVESVRITDGNINITVGNQILLTPEILPPDASDKEVTWTSSNENTATVSITGNVSAIAQGTSIITLRSKENPGKSNSVTVTVNPSVAVMTPQEIFESLKGKRVTTCGWADMANSGQGLSYANPANLILIDDASYPIPENKYKAFLNAVMNSVNIDSATGVISGTAIDTAKFIIISGDIDLSNGRINDGDKSFYDAFGPAPNYNRINGNIIARVGSNTTIIGVNSARIMFGGISVSGKSNVIIRNITFWDAHGSTDQSTTYFPDSKAGIDALVIQGTSDGVWVDHCLFTNGTCTDMIRNFNHDGALDIPQGKNVTVSWSEFTNYDKVMLVAGNDSLTNVLDRQITLHHNYFHYTTQRMPRTRGTQMHVYNNYYNDIGVQGNSGYAMGPGVNAHFVVENNFFGSILSNKVVDYYDNPTYPAIVWSSGNNKTVNRSSNDSGNSKPWEPAYLYPLEPNSGLPATIPGKAGPTLVFYK